MERSFDPEAISRWLGASGEVAAHVETVRLARSEAATTVAAASEAEAALSEFISEAEAAHAVARALDDGVKAKIETGGPATMPVLIKRRDAERTARAAAFEVVSQSEVTANLFDAAAVAVRNRAEAEIAYMRAVSAAEMALDDVVPEDLE